MSERKFDNAGTSAKRLSELLSVVFFTLFAVEIGHVLTKSNGAWIVLRRFSVVHAILAWFFLGLLLIIVVCLIVYIAVFWFEESTSLLKGKRIFSKETVYVLVHWLFIGFLPVALTNTLNVFILKGFGGIETMVTNMEPNIMNTCGLPILYSFVVGVYVIVSWKFWDKIKEWLDS